MTNQPETIAENSEVLANQLEETGNQLVVPQEVQPVQPKLDELGRAYSTGRRKSSVARVWLKAGTGVFTVNGQPIADYFRRKYWVNHAQQPLLVTNNDQLDVMATVKGGGSTGQAGAVRYGISRALLNFDPNLRPVLRNAGLLTRDAREVERKKYGLKKARRRFQFSKR